MSATTGSVPNMMTSFITGAKKGCNLFLTVVIPNVVFAFVVIRLLTLLGVIGLLGKVFAPAMAVFGLPGEASFALVFSYISFTGAITSIAALMESGVLTEAQGLAMLPFTLLTGSIFMWTGRILAVTGIALKDYKICYAIATINGILSLFVMRIVLNF